VFFCPILTSEWGDFIAESFLPDKMIMSSNQLRLSASELKINIKACTLCDGDLPFPAKSTFSFSVTLKIRIMKKISQLCRWGSVIRGKVNQMICLPVANARQHGWL
jgi:hypothetical protein